MANSARNRTLDDGVVLHVNKDASETCEGSGTSVPFLQKVSPNPSFVLNLIYY